MFSYPATRQDGVTDRHHGHDLTDKFRWLEDGDAPEVQEWATAQTAFTAATIREHCDPSAFVPELSALLLDKDSIGLPALRAGWYYRYVRRAGQNQAALCRSRSYDPDGEFETVIDPNGLRADDAVSLTASGVSPLGTYLAYALSEAGTEMSTIRVRSLATGEDIVDEIPFCRHPSICWTADESGFFYTRNPEPGTVDKHDEHYFARVCFHRLGDNWRDDEIIFGEGRHKEDAYGLSMSDDRRTLIIGASRDWSSSSVYLYDTASRRLTTLVEGEGAQYGLDIIRGRAYLWTNRDAEFGKVLVADVTQLGVLPVTEWTEFISERSYALQSFSFTDRYVIVDYLRNACSYVEILDMDGRLVRELAMPEFSTLSGLSCDDERVEVFFSVDSYLVPSVQYRWDGTDAVPVEIRRVDGQLDPDDYLVTQEWYESTGGVRVPMFVIRGRNVRPDGDNPALLYGYGGFNNSETPGFTATFVSLLRRGCVVAVANIRGGGEFGEGWHEAGMLANKQNSFDDFIAGARWLIANGWTSPRRLAIYGGSNGGLLVGACAMQAPELFEAVVCSVPLLDMVRFPQFLIASRWMSEYGDPSDPEHFEWIISWSPYHNFDPTRQYPSMLFLTADHDTRVDPLHARKMTALAQSGASTNPVFVRVEVNAGHGSGTPMSQVVAGRAEMLAFLAWRLGFKA